MKQIIILDIIKANRKGSREAELDFNKGWSQIKQVYRSKKIYTRKEKHKNN